MYPSLGMAEVLAASDWQSLVAGLVFVLVSMAAGWLKKRSEADSNPSRGQEPEKSVPAETFDKPKSFESMQQKKGSKRPPLLVVQRNRSEVLAAPPKRARRLAGEWQTRVAGTTYQSTKVSAFGTTERPGFPKPAQPSLVADSREAVAPDRPFVHGGLFPEMHDPIRLRRAIIAAEILNPPLALRDPDSTFGHVI